jgi:hypothetical protein
MYNKMYNDLKTKYKSIYQPIRFEYRKTESNSLCSYH